MFLYNKNYFAKKWKKDLDLDDIFISRGGAVWTYEEKWQAVTQSASQYDGIFYFAAEITKLFCKPSCKSRIPLKSVYYKKRHFLLIEEMSF